MARNSAFIKTPLTGIEGISSVLNGLPAEMKTQILATAVGHAAKPVVAAARALAPRRTGALKRSITSLVRKYKNNQSAVAVVGPDNAYYGSGKRLKNGQSRAGADKPANYAHLVEFGHYSATASGVSGRASKGTSRRKGTFTERSYIMPKPFMRPAVAGSAAAAGESLAEGIRKGIERTRAKLVKKGVHTP